MTDSLTTRIDKALAVTRAATPGPWSGVSSYRDPDCRDGIITSVKANGDQWCWQDESAIVLWRAVAEQALEVAKAAQAVGCTCEMRSDRPGMTSHDSQCLALTETLGALSISLEKAGRLYAGHCGNYA